MSEPRAGAADDPVAAVDGLLDRLVSVLSGTAAGGPDSVGTAADADGVGSGITATVGADGRLRELEIDARLLRRPDAIGAGIAAAVNDALRNRPPRSAGAGMTEELQAIQEQSLTVTREVNASLLSAVERLKGY
jgi:hypothetical protein